MPGSLFGLLVRNYLLFTLTLLAMAGVVFALWSSWLDSLYQPADWNSLLSDPALAAGDYEVPAAAPGPGWQRLRRL